MTSQQPLFKQDFFIYSVVPLLSSDDLLLSFRLLNKQCSMAARQVLNLQLMAIANEPAPATAKEILAKHRSNKTNYRNNSNAVFQAINLRSLYQCFKCVHASYLFLGQHAEMTCNQIAQRIKSGNTTSVLSNSDEKSLQSSCIPPFLHKATADLNIVNRVVAIHDCIANILSYNTNFKRTIPMVKDESCMLFEIFLQLKKMNFEVKQHLVKSYLADLKLMYTTPFKPLQIGVDKLPVNWSYNVNKQQVLANSVGNTHQIQVVYVGTNKDEITSLINTIVNGNYSSDSIAPANMQSFQSIVTLPNQQKIEMTLMNGMCDYDLVQSYSFNDKRNSSGPKVFVLCYAVNDPDSFKQIEIKWLHEIHHALCTSNETNHFNKFVLLGLKKDCSCENLNIITNEQGFEMATKLRFHAHGQVSAKLMENVSEVNEMTATLGFMAKHQTNQQSTSSTCVVV